jgi:hypothetical protein
MANVLPLPAQKDLWSTHRARFVSAFAIVLIVLAGIAGLSLIPGAVAVEMSLHSATESPGGTTAAEGLRAMTKAQAQLSAVRSTILSTSTPPTEVIEQALSLRPKGVTIDRIRFVGGTQKQMIVSGRAAREGLTAYRDALEQETLFTSVTVPVGALFGDSGTFSITLTGNF